MSPIIIATRGSALALAQSNAVLASCRKKFPKLAFELKIIKTTGDKLQTAPPDAAAALATRALFTKELETALLEEKADFAVHSLKDLPTELPAGLKLAGVAGEREDVRDVLIYRIDKLLTSKMTLAEFPPGLVVATGSARRQTQLLAARPDFETIPIRGNVPTRLQKLLDQTNLDATILAAAGLSRLGMKITSTGHLEAPGIVGELGVFVFEPEVMLPCVGQGAIGLEIRENDERTAEICQKLDHVDTFQCVVAERAFLEAMGGGCQTPIGAYACLSGNRIHLRAVAHLTKNVQRGEAKGARKNAVALGQKVAALVRGGKK